MAKPCPRRNENYNTSLKLLDKAIEIDPNEAGYWNNKGMALKEIENYRESAAALQRAVELDPGCARCWNNLGLSLAKLEKFGQQ